MNNSMFEELKESISQAGAIRRGERKPAKVTHYPETNVKVIRNGLELSPFQFATLLGISASTLQGWEQGRRKPRGAARVLLKIAEQHPEVVFEVNHMKYQKKSPLMTGVHTVEENQNSKTKPIHSNNLED